MAVVLAQTIGLVHRSAHFQSSGMVYAHDHSSHDGHSHENGDSDDVDVHGLLQADKPSWLSQLFAHQEGDSTCHLIDAQSNCDAAPAVFVQILPFLPSRFLTAFSQILSSARFAALFDARGPPALA